MASVLALPVLLHHLEQLLDRSTPWSFCVAYPAVAFQPVFGFYRPSSYCSRFLVPLLHGFIPRTAEAGSGSGAMGLELVNGRSEATPRSVR